jgi:hypothetical protein
MLSRKILFNKTAPCADKEDSEIIDIQSDRNAFWYMMIRKWPSSDSRTVFMGKNKRSQVSESDPALIHVLSGTHDLELELNEASNSQN